MKKFLSLLFVLVLATITINAQQYDVLDQVRADTRKSRGMEGPHRMEEMTAPTKAPKGYKPFYISHYGRHGSRYCWNSKTYSLMRDVFTKARELDVLTPYGEEFANKYFEFYELPFINSGDLVPLGFDQHRQIGEYVYKNFPQVFKGSRKVDALSSTAQRCIVSMSAFVQGLTSGNGKLEVRQASNHAGMSIIAPPSAPEKLVRHFEGESADIKAMTPQEFMDSHPEVRNVLEKLFTDSSFLKEFKGGEDGFINEMWSLCTNYHNYVEDPLFDSLYSDDERVINWEVNNYMSYYTDLRVRYMVIPLLEDVISKADAAFQDTAWAANLRFGHDYILEAFATLINLNSCGTVVDTPDQAKYWFQSYNVPMAATILFVFYKGKGDDILFKVLWNEREAVLPQLQAVTGPYYRWQDFKDWTKDLLEAYPEIR